MDGSLDGSTDGYAGRIEVLEGRSGRRLRSEAERARIAAESLVPGAKVADVARRHGVTRWQVYDWRRKLRSGALAMPAAAMREPMFAALVVERPEPAPPRSERKSDGEARPSRIELVVEGVVLRVRSDVDEDQLTGLIRAIRTASR
jgi:transposase